MPSPSGRLSTAASSSRELNPNPTSPAMAGRNKLRSSGKWWLQPEEEIASCVTSKLDNMEMSQTARQRRYAGYANLYGNSQWYGGTPRGANGIAASWQRNRDVPTFNVIQSVTDWATSKLGKDQPRVWFLTDDGNFHERRKAKKLTRFNDGVSYECRTDEKLVRMLTDGEVFGDGFVKVFARHGKIAQARVLPGDLWIPETEMIDGGDPREMHHVMAMDRGVLAQRFPGKKKQIESAPQLQIPTLGWSGGDVSDLIVVRESWHLPSGPDAGDGRHAFTVDGNEGGVLLGIEEWEYEFFPFAHFRWCPRVYGTLGQGIAEQLKARQSAINKIGFLLDRSFHLQSAFLIACQRGSKINLAHLARNEIGRTIEFDTIPPQFMTPNPVSQQTLTYWKQLIAECYEVIGASMMAATGVKPAGLDSGEAQRVYHDINSERFWAPGKELENAALQIARLNIATARQIASSKKTKGYRVRIPMPGGYSHSDWSEVGLEPNEFGEDPFIMKAYATSPLPTEPAGRLAAIQERLQAGMYTPSEALRLMGNPDLQQIDTLRSAAEERIYQVTDRIVDMGEFPPENWPDARDNLQLALQVGTEMFKLGQTHELEPDRLAMLDQYIVAVEQLIDEAKQQAMAASPAATMAPQAQLQPQLQMAA